jgi:hypothetical protein
MSGIYVELASHARIIIQPTLPQSSLHVASELVLWANYGGYLIQQGLPHGPSPTFPQSIFLLDCFVMRWLAFLGLLECGWQAIPHVLAQDERGLDA